MVKKKQIFYLVFRFIDLDGFIYKLKFAVSTCVSKEFPAMLPNTDIHDRGANLCFCLQTKRYLIFVALGRFRGATSCSGVDLQAAGYICEFNTIYIFKN